LRSPLAALAACIALGILLGRLKPAGVGVIPVLIVTGGICLLAGLFLLRAGWRRAPFLAALAGFVVAGATAAHLFEFRFPPYHVSRLATSGVDLDDPVRLQGRLVSTPQRTSYGLQFDVDVQRVESRGQVHPTTGKVRLRLQTSEDPEASAAADSLHLQYGDAIRTMVRLRRPRIYQNPGSFDFRRWMESIEDVYWVGMIKNPLLVEKLRHSGFAGLAALFE
jgi:predicted membrane metal-binding protein